MNSVSAVKLAKSPTLFNLIRNFSVTSTNAEKGFLSTFFEKKVEVQSTTHSDKLSDKDRIFELCTHNVKPDSLDKYVKTTENLIGFVKENNQTLHGDNIGSFQVTVGDQDQFVHLWRFDGGYANIDENLKFLSTSKEYAAIQKDMLPLLRNRHSQYLMKFSFWPETELRNGNNIYELRSYHLKPGTMVEWGNYWAKAIRLRDYKHTEGYIGMFSQVGELYNVKHIWCYSGLEERRQAREIVWQHQQSQWQDIVANTVPLIRQMTSRIMVPLPMSPTK